MKPDSRMRLAAIVLGTVLGGTACSVKDTGKADSARADTAGGPAPTVADSPSGGDSVAPGVTTPGAAAAGTGATPATPAAGAPRPAAPVVTPRPTAPTTGTSAASPADTVRGIVAETGSMPMTQVIVRAAGGRVTTITGSLAREIGRAAGGELWVRGRRSGQELEATAYAVRSIDGQPAVDGTVARDGERLVLVTGSGRRVIAQPPPALRGMIGARVWLVGPLDGRITSYGVLREP